MSVGLYSGTPGLALGVGLWSGVPGFWSGAAGLIDGLGAALDLNFLAGAPLDSRITFTRASTATYVNSAGNIASAAINTPRFDYDPVTLAPRGLLVEEQRTNLLTYSEQIDNAAWSKTNITVTSAAATSPDGTVDAQKIQATATAATSVIAPTTTIAATSATFSIYVKQGTGSTTANTFTLRNVTAAANLIRGTLNYSTGVFTYLTGTTGVTVTNAGNGWWRLAMTATSGITSGDTIRGYVGFDGGSQTTGDHLFAWGAQLEAGSFATSYIPTVASQVTRTADVATITGANFSQWYNQSEGTFVAGFSQLYSQQLVGTQGGIVRADDGTNNNQISIVKQSNTNQIWASVTSGGAGGLSGNIGPHNANETKTAALAYKSGDSAGVLSGGTPLTSASANVPTALDRLRIGSSSISAGAWMLNGHIRSIQYYNTRLANTVLQGITA